MANSYERSNKGKRDEGTIKKAIELIEEGSTILHAAKETGANYNLLYYRVQKLGSNVQIKRQATKLAPEIATGRERAEYIMALLSSGNVSVRDIANEWGVDISRVYALLSHHKVWPGKNVYINSKNPDPIVVLKTLRADPKIISVNVLAEKVDVSANKLQKLFKEFEMEKSVKRLFRMRSRS